jgi:hypothetical protein
VSSHYLGDGASTRHDRSRLFELARVLVRFDHVARRIKDANLQVTPSQRLAGAIG